LHCNKFSSETDVGTTEKLQKAANKIKALEQALGKYTRICTQTYVYDMNCASVAVVQTEKAAQATNERNELRQQFTMVGDSIQQHDKDHRDVLNEITRQYKNMQDDLLERINDLELQVVELKDQLGK